MSENASMKARSALLNAERVTASAHRVGETALFSFFVKQGGNRCFCSAGRKGILPAIVVESVASDCASQGANQRADKA
ncbi:hypothetical protein ACQK5W_07295 [Pantoea sp. FN060301]|uniref:hypothetical protein n=1 Tax=Pantoea sp. FN060301 TaxID=3420380 RepID=UPI003D164150